MLGECFGEPGRAGRTRRTDGGEDPSAARMELLVRGTARAERELVDAIAREARVRVTVDEARDRRQPATVDLVDVAVERSEVAHPTDCLDPPAFAEHVGVVGHGDVA